MRAAVLLPLLLAGCGYSWQYDKSEARLSSGDESERDGLANAMRGLARPSAAGDVAALVMNLAGESRESLARRPRIADHQQQKPAENSTMTG